MKRKLKLFVALGVYFVTALIGLDVLQHFQPPVFTAELAFYKLLIFLYIVYASVKISEWVVSNE